jgi:hypothetical protein
MKDKVGYQIGTANNLPMNEEGIVNLIISSINWQENEGPCIIFVDEPFYRFLIRTGIDIIYHDIIPLPPDASSDEVAQYIDSMFPVEIHRVKNLHRGGMERNEIKEYMNMVPLPIQEKWDSLLMNEEMILSLSQVNSN